MKWGNYTVESKGRSSSLLSYFIYRDYERTSDAVKHLDIEF